MSQRRPNSPPLHDENLFDFFSRRVEDARTERGLALSRWTTTYLAHLLVRIGRTRDLFRDDTPDTLAEIHLAARAAERAESVRLYRYLGDRALSVAGYFSDSLRRAVVGRDYYEAMGGTAYGQVARLSAVGGHRAASDDPWTGVFVELADKMSGCVALLSDVALRDRAEGARDVVQLYELWLRSGSPHAARRLGELGVLATPPEAEAS